MGVDVAVTAAVVVETTADVAAAITAVAAQMAATCAKHKKQKYKYRGKWAALKSRPLFFWCRLY